MKIAITIPNHILKDDPSAVELMISRSVKDSRKIKSLHPIQTAQDFVNDDTTIIIELNDE